MIASELEEDCLVRGLYSV